MGLRASIERYGKTATAILALITLSVFALKAAARMCVWSLFAWLFVPLPWIAVTLATLALALLIYAIKHRSTRLPKIRSLTEPQRHVLKVLALAPRSFTTPDQIARSGRLSDIECENAAIELEQSGLMRRQRWPGNAYSLTDAGIRYVAKHLL
jgi:hypothetical protein